MARVLRDWLQTYLEFTEGQESPEALHFWTGVAVLSAAIKRQIFMDRVFYRLYPNVFVLVVAESARARKSVAINIGLKLLREAIPDIYIVGGRMTPEGLLTHMNRETIILKEGGGAIVKTASHTLIHADELATLFGYDKLTASRMSILLTELYASPEKYEHTTVDKGHKVVELAYPTLLAATDPRNLSVLPEDSVGGLFGRLVITSATEKRKPIAWLEKGAKYETLKTTLVADLAEIGQLSGLFTPSPAARARFKEWYDARADLSYESRWLDAFNERCHDTVLKLAMILSISRGNSLIVEKEHIDLAISFIEKQPAHIRRIMAWMGGSNFAQNRARFLEIIARANGKAINRRMLVRAMGVSIEEFNQVEATLATEGTITREGTAADVIYRLGKEHGDER